MTPNREGTDLRTLAAAVGATRPAMEEFTRAAAEAVAWLRVAEELLREDSDDADG